jgi:hypothetical protein
MEIEYLTMETRHEFTYRLVDADPIPEEYTRSKTPRVFQPDTASVLLIDGQPTRVTVRGPRVLKGGLSEKEVFRRGYIGRSDICRTEPTLRSADSYATDPPPPAWIRGLAERAARNVDPDWTWEKNNG